MDEGKEKLLPLTDFAAFRHYDCIVLNGIGSGISMRIHVL